MNFSGQQRLFWRDLWAEMERLGTEDIAHMPIATLVALLDDCNELEARVEELEKQLKDKEAKNEYGAGL